MADSYELYKLEPRLDDQTAQVSDEAFHLKTPSRSRSWTGPESVAETSIGSPSEATSLRNGLSARHASLKSRSCRFPSRQGDIVRALEAREQNRSFGRLGDISKALEARERNRVSLQRGECVDERDKKGRATESTTAGGANAHLHFEGEPKGNSLLSEKKAVGGTVLLNARPQQETQSTLSTPAAAGGSKKHRKSNLKSSSIKAAASLDEDRKDAPRGRVLILTSAGPLEETGVSTPQGQHPVDGFSRSSKKTAHVAPPPEASSVRFSVPIVLPGQVGVGTVQTKGGGYQLDQGEGSLGPDVSLHDRGAGRPWVIKDEEEPSRVPPGGITRSTEITSESSRSNDMAATNWQGPSIQVSPTEQERKDFSTMDDSQDSAVLDADLEARLRRLKANDESSLSSPFGEIPTTVMSLSDQVKALRSGSTRLLVSHLTSSACAPYLSTRVLSMSSSRLPPSVSDSRVQGLQKMQTPAPSNQPFRPEEEVRIFEVPVEEGEVLSFLESVLDEVQLASPEADRRKDAEQMKENLYGPQVLKSFSLKDVNEELSKVSQEAESLAREAENLIQWANVTARLGQEWADEEELDSFNGDRQRPVTHTEACLSH